MRTFIPNREVDDAVESTVVFANGAVGTLEATRLALGRRNAFQWEINGTKGSLAFDMERLNADLKQHGAEIQGLIQRNLDQADALGLTGTPVYLIGPFKASGALTYEQFRKAVADARVQSKQ